MIKYMYFPKTKQLDSVSDKIVKTFEAVSDKIDSVNHQLKSNEVLAVVRLKLEEIGFSVEKSKQAEDKIHVPVLFGLNGKVEKAFEADAYYPTEKYIVEVEAGRGVTNYQFLKDFFEACAMYEVEYLCIAVRNIYRNNNDFDKVCLFFDTFYQSNRINIPLNGLLIVGY